ncbi:hypothetical protein L6164_037704 [Bauhinia variegata]|uniref:Uncharacterized protein n=1 Tax=Bauhinia variegata TaxID=167791 RepID=A0ACB9KLD7_BAUVA|nr:hypothetical protein L6164_037704 [Bauhinia variegata]
MSLGVHKGPITLNFQQGGQQIQHDTSKIMSPYANKPASYNQVYPVGGSLLRQNQQEQLPQHQQQQQQQSGYNSSFDYLKSNSFVSSASNSHPSMEISGGLLMDNDFSLHELTMNNAFSTDIKNDGYFM